MTHKIIRADGVTELTPIKTFTIQQSVNTDVDLRPGCVSSERIEVEVFGSATDAPASGEALTVYEVDEELNETQIGIFYANPAVSSKTTYMFTAYDGMKNTAVDFSQRLRGIQGLFPITLGALVDEALDVAGMTRSGTFPMMNMPVQQFLQDGLTCRDILSYAAEIACRFVRCDPDGGVVFDWYSDAEYAPDPTLAPRIYPNSGQTSTEIYIPYKQDGMEREAHDIDAIASCAVHPSDNEADPVVYPASGVGYVEANTVVVSDASPGNFLDMEITIPFVSGRQYSGVDIHVTGKNLFGPTNQGTEDGYTYQRGSDGKYAVSGTGTGSDVAYFTLGELPLPPGVRTLVFSGNMSGSNPVGDSMNWWTYCESGPNRKLVSANLTGTGSTVLTVPEHIECTYIGVASAIDPRNTINNAEYAPMFCLNATDGTEYEPYGTTYSVDWSDVVSNYYGGTFNPVTGLLIAKYDQLGRELPTPAEFHVDPIDIQSRDGRMTVWAHDNGTRGYMQPFYPISIEYPSSSSYEGNTLHIRNNLLLAGATHDTLSDVAENIYNGVHGIGAYRPATINLFPFENPFKVGDIVNVTDSQNVSFKTVVMSMTVGPSAAVIGSTGNEEYDADSADVAKSLQNLTDNIIRVNKLKVSWADIDEAIIRSLQTNYLKILGLLVSGEFTGPESLVTQLVDSIIQFFRGDDSQMFGAIGLNQIDSTDNALHVSSTDDGDTVAVDYFTGTEYKPAYEADFTDPDNPENTFTGTMTLNGNAIPTQADLATKMSHWDLLWENPSITSVFAGQTLTPSFAGYDFFLLIYGLSNTSPNNRMSMFLKVGEQASMSFTSWYGSSTMAVTDRSFYFTSNKIHFNDCTRHVSGQSSSSTYNNGAIPQKIYGIKNS